MSASAGGLTGMFLFRMGLFVNRNIEEKAWSLLVTINSAFIAMVASCGGCDSITPWGAILVGVVAAVIFLGIRRLTTKFDLLDDPLDCVAVHFGGGWWGLISAGLLSERGLVSGDSSMLKWNFGAGLCITLWSFATSGLLFFILRLFGVLRVTLDNEYKGADIVKHKEPAYTPFAYGSGPYEDQARPLPTEQKVSRADDLKGKWQNSDASENNRVLARSRYPMHLINNSDGIEPINRSPTSRKESASNPYAAARLEDDMLKFFEDKLKKHHCCQTDACNCHSEYKELNDDLRN
ncbi:unnamed protein product [Notodromas monacha]|uniref:Ammonium transporter AmtB-like domain-containing protein n=1 Tax=Notodromas monacha TaxID=399045 RepID=A0A7R9GDJ3_9CRUS|nr:unnamed protein product [Notodromas monacha]CAG0917026.1 unnamed protein product [Notodromas monacha]